MQNLLHIEANDQAVVSTIMIQARFLLEGETFQYQGEVYTVCFTVEHDGLLEVVEEDSDGGCLTLEATSQVLLISTTPF